MMRPMYMLMVDFSSLVIRPPFIRSRSTQLNQKPATSVTPFSQTRGAIRHGPSFNFSTAMVRRKWGRVLESDIRGQRSEGSQISRRRQGYGVTSQAALAQFADDLKK